MLLNLLLVTIVLIAVGGRSGAVVNQDVARSNCSFHNQTVNAYRGWPFEFKIHDYVDSFVAGGFSQQVQTLITDESNGNVVFNQTSFLFNAVQWAYLTPDLHQDTRYTVRSSVLGKSKCESHNVMLYVRDAVESCEVAVRRDNGVWNAKAFGSSPFLKCQPPGSVEHKPVLDRNLHNFSVKWLRDCKSTLPNNTWLSLPPGQTFEQLYFENFQADDVGVYTCAVTYKGNTRFVRSHKVCTQVQQAKGPGLVSCDKEVYLVPRLGTNLTINCSLGVGIGVVSNAMISTYWNKTKDSNFECINTVYGLFHPGEGNNSRHSCIRTLKKPPQECFRTPPTPEQLKNEEEYVIATLHLVDIQPQDIGTYSVVYESAKGQKTFHNVTVMLDDRSVATSNAVKLGVGVGIAVAFLLLLLLLWTMRFHVKVFWKTCCAAYDLDDKQYGVFLSYHFSMDTDIFAQQQIRETCTAVRDVLEGMGLLVYDEHKDGGDAGSRAANSINAIGKCHRVVIILTHEYVRDNWSVFQLQQSFKTMIESGSRLVFVLVPGMKAYINQQALKDDTYRMIKRAMKLNTVTTWPDTSACCSRTMRLKMRLAMPKLRKHEGWKRRSSSDSEFGMHPPGVERILSNITATTDIGPDDVDVALK